jgi:apolipoprotein N-acyltransferase
MGFPKEGFMDITRAWRASRSWLWLLVGSACFTFIGWRYNVAIAAWIAPVFLIRFFRGQKHWYATLPAVVTLAVASYIQMYGGWDLDPWMIPLFSVLRPAAFLAALYADRLLVRRLPVWAASLVYPAVYLTVDWLIVLTPLGDLMSASITQFGLPAVSQLASLTGIWGLGFLMGWIAAVINAAWEKGLGQRGTPREGGPIAAAARSAAGAMGARRLAIAAACVVAAVVALGSARAALILPSSATVRVGSITVEHPRDYWDWIDAHTPRDVVADHSAELTGITERLFSQSERAAAAGARVIFWSEGNAVLTEDNEQAFMERASAFASRHGVYFAPGMVVLRYGQTVSDNKMVMFAPDGTRAYTYVKTMSWYPTGSDGILRTVDTPYGRIGTAICFDMDFPSFIHRLGALKTDIVLDASFDSKGIRPYHTEAALLRGIENGFSLVKQTNTGTSMAIDGTGRVLARLDSFETADQLMLSDVPTRRVPTLYRVLGEWFAYLGMALAAGLCAWGILRGRARKR